MDLLSLVVMLIVVGVLLGLLNRYGGPWISPAILSIINIVVIVAIVLFILNLFLGIGSLHTIHVGR